MKRIIGTGCGVVALAIFIAIGTLGYFGFIPTISSALGTSKPRDLGITYTPEDQQRAYKKNAVQANALPKAETISNSIRYEGQQSVNFTLTPSEITALINSNTWQYNPISNIQIKLHPDGTGEASGIIHIDRILPYVSLTHPTEEVQAAINTYHLGGNPAFYVKGNVSVTDNNVQFNADYVEIGRFPIPMSLVKSNISAAEQFAEKRIQAVPNLYVKSLTHENGLVNFTGIMPEREYKAE